MPIDKLWFGSTLHGLGYGGRLAVQSKGKQSPSWYDRVRLGTSAGYGNLGMATRVRQLGYGYMGMAGRAEHGWSAWGKQSPSWLSGLYCPSSPGRQSQDRGQRGTSYCLQRPKVTACARTTFVKSEVNSGISWPEILLKK